MSTTASAEETGACGGRAMRPREYDAAPRRPQSPRPAKLKRDDARGQERIAARAGLVRIAIGVLTAGSALTLPLLEPFRGLAVAYLALAVLFQWVIQKRVLRTTIRTIAMGVVDLAVLSFFVQRLGTAGSPLPVIYVATPVLYATTTQRRRVSVVIAFYGVLLYATLHLLEVFGVLDYAPAVPGMPVPDLLTRAAYIVLVTICCTGTALLTSQLIRALSEANERLRDLSQHDELTGLYNRRYVMQRLDDELARLRRKPVHLTVALVDLDGFKRVNDEIGHDAGDEVLRAAAGALQLATRKADVVARYGGDEFVILFPDTETEGARTVSTRILDQTRDAVRAVCPSIPVTASIGTTVVQPGDEPAEIIRRVDEQLYAAKRAGGDRVFSG